MEHHVSLLAHWLTVVLGLQQHPWPGFAEGLPLSWLERYDHLFCATLAALATLAICFAVKRKLARVPSPMQAGLESVLKGLQGLLDDSIAHHSEKYLPLVGTLTLFVFFCNLFGMVPGLNSPTSNWNVTLGCALLVFLYYNFEGLKKVGPLKYLAHFAGPVWWLAWLIFPLEVIGLFARILSHSVRLFANMSGEHVVSGLMFTALPLILPVPGMVLGLFSVLIQTFVFVLLTVIYISLAVAEEH
jgi:F-type H+-transporting ATPase subunit a